MKVETQKNQLKYQIEGTALDLTVPQLQVVDRLLFRQRLAVFVLKLLLAVSIIAIPMLITAALVNL